ncbi:unnamed protein product [Protopolystoma xenopodis]|uniref:Uncharacterized protein n=1 Tax=Protopolystoma xenopodis TaxID=117903 RepID=A0A3S4ZL27_9PLAT|nr:unnamed protein product [Protopolystoma xenopodis]
MLRQQTRLNEQICEAQSLRRGLEGTRLRLLESLPSRMHLTPQPSYSAGSTTPATTTSDQSQGAGLNNPPEIPTASASTSSSSSSSSGFSSAATVDCSCLGRPSCRHQVAPKQQDSLGLRDHLSLKDSLSVAHRFHSAVHKLSRQLRTQIHSIQGKLDLAIVFHITDIIGAMSHAQTALAQIVRGVAFTNCAGFLNVDAAGGRVRSSVISRKPPRSLNPGANK